MRTHRSEETSHNALRESAAAKLKYILLFALFAIFFSMVIIGQKTTGPVSLLVQLCGILGILLLLYFYNRKYQ